MQLKNNYSYEEFEKEIKPILFKYGVVEGMFIFEDVDDPFGSLFSIRDNPLSENAVKDKIKAALEGWKFKSGEVS